MKPITRRFGVEFINVDLRQRIASGQIRDIREAFEEHSLLLFRRQVISDEEHIALARLFGPVEDRNADERKKGETFEVPQVSNVNKDGSLTKAADLHTLQLKSNQLWHTDSTFMPVPALANIILAKTVSSSGGETELATTRAAFEDMDEAEKNRLRSITISHHYAWSRSKISKELASQPMFHKWPAQHWPAVWKNPKNGKEAVYVASHAYGASGMKEPEALAFIEDLISHCTKDRYTYLHQWQPGDLLIWDERATLHRGRPWPLDEARVLKSICVSVTDQDGLAAMQTGVHASART